MNTLLDPAILFFVFGVLAGGIAHDFNNLLTGILGNAALARQEINPASPAQAHLEQIEAVTQRAGDLCKQMLAYSGKGRFEIRRLNLSELVRETTDVVEKLCIEAALQLNDNNRASSADMLGLSRQSLYVKLHRHGIEEKGGPEKD